MSDHFAALNPFKRSLLILKLHGRPTVPRRMRMDVQWVLGVQPVGKLGSHMRQVLAPKLLFDDIAPWLRAVIADFIEFDDW
jgi:hypothetical protein